MSATLLDTFGTRLVELAPGKSGLRASLEVKATVDPANSDLLTMVASDATLDRYREVIDAAGWDLTNYLRNPVIQNSHQTEDILHTIGRAERTWVEGGKLMQVWKFASAANPVAKVARDLYAGGFLNASSVGFLPKLWENGGTGAAYDRKFTQQELIEVSAVAIPANPSALALGVKSGAVDVADLRELAQLLKHFVSKEGPAPKPGASGSVAEIAQLATLAKQLNEVLARS